MKLRLAILILINFEVLVSVAKAQSSPEALASNLCSGKPNNFKSDIQKIKSGSFEKCGDCTSAGLENILLKYHPAVVHQTYQAALHSGKLLDGQKWPSAVGQNAALRQETFGSSECSMGIARFRKSQFDLSYFLVSHVVRGSDEERRSTFAAMSDEFKFSKPEMVVIEGYPEEFYCTEAVRI